MAITSPTGPRTAMTVIANHRFPSQHPDLVLPAYTFICTSPHTVACSSPSPLSLGNAATALLCSALGFGVRVGHDAGTRRLLPTHDAPCPLARNRLSAVCTMPSFQRASTAEIILSTGSLSFARTQILKQTGITTPTQTRFIHPNRPCPTLPCPCLADRPWPWPWPCPPRRHLRQPTPSLPCLPPHTLSYKHKTHIPRLRRTAVSPARSPTLPMLPCCHATARARDTCRITRPSPSAPIWPGVINVCHV